MIDIDFKTLTDRDYIIIGKMWEMKSTLSEHRVAMALKLKRPLKKSEVVHHINHNNKDNNPNNLLLCKDKSEHYKYHGSKWNEPIKYHRIKMLRENKNLTQEELAKLIGFNRTWISWIETGRMLPTKDTLLKISRVLGCEYTDLYRDENLEIIESGSSKNGKCK